MQVVDLDAVSELIMQAWSSAEAELQRLRLQKLEVILADMDQEGEGKISFDEFEAQTRIFPMCSTSFCYICVAHWCNLQDFQWA